MFFFPFRKWWVHFNRWSNDSTITIKTVSAYYSQSGHEMDLERELTLQKTQSYGEELKWFPNQSKILWLQNQQRIKNCFQVDLEQPTYFK